MKGILGEPDMKKGKILSDVVKAKILEFYESDEYSLMCPGQKEFVSVKEGGERKQKQKRLLLVNLKELHTEFVRKTEDIISFSKFCELHPKWCHCWGQRNALSLCLPASPECQVSDVCHPAAC